MTQEVARGSAPLVVVGSLHMDLIVSAPRLPRAGETVLATGHGFGPGGKGGNQAVAVARLGQPIVMVGAVGADEHGRRVLAALSREGVDVSYIGVDDALPTGLAVVAVDAAGENSILVSGGASAALPVTAVDRAAAALLAAHVTLLSLEVPIDAVVAAARLAGGTVVLNPAPAQPLPEALLRRVDVLVPNRGELGVLAGTEEPGSIAEVVALARAIPGPLAVVVSLGAAGAVVVSGPETRHVRAPAVEVIDTTGAGDALCGALADALARGTTLLDAVGFAVRAASLSTTRSGAQPGLPRAADVAAERGLHYYGVAHGGLDDARRRQP